jgi:hypothetical protein
MPARGGWSTRKLGSFEDANEQSLGGASQDEQSHDEVYR